MSEKIIKNKIDLIIIRGGGDLATGTIHRLQRAGYPLLVLEAENPRAVRREVSFCEAMYDGTKTVEGLRGRKIERADRELLESVWAADEVPLLADPKCLCLGELKPQILIDMIVAKRNKGTRIDMAPLTIAAGPGFEAGKDVDVVVETMRGHNLGRIIFEGSALPRTGIPGNIGGYTRERVIHAPADGILENLKEMGTVLEQGEHIAVVHGFDRADHYVEATIPGLLRGLIRDGYRVYKTMKIADIDPRAEELKNCFTISDKARSIAGSMLELVCSYEHGRLQPDRKVRKV